MSLPVLHGCFSKDIAKAAINLYVMLTGHC